MILLDENIIDSQRRILLKHRLRIRQIGHEVGRAGMSDSEIIPLLHRLPNSTLFTRDRDFYKPGLIHAHYCLVFLEVTKDEVAEYLLRFLHHAAFISQGKRNSKVIRVTPRGFTILAAHSPASSGMW